MRMNLTQSKFRKELEIEKQKVLERKRKEILRTVRKKYRRKLKKPSTSKLLLWAAVFISVEILIYCEVAYFLYQDPGFLAALVGVPITLAPIAHDYMKKSTAENTSGGIVYETAMQDRGETP